MSIHQQVSTFVGFDSNIVDTVEEAEDRVNEFIRTFGVTVHSIQAQTLIESIGYYHIITVVHDVEKKA